MTATFKYFRGAPIIIDLVIDDAGQIDPAAASVVMKLKAGARPSPMQAGKPAVADFVVSYVPAQGVNRGFWRGTIAPGAEIPAGTYVTDAVISIGGAVIGATDYVLIRIIEGVSL